MVGIKDDFMDESEPSTIASSRDEVKEIQILQQKETSRIRAWRWLLALALIVTGVVVTMTTYSSLVREENNKFTEAVSSLLRAVSHATNKWVHTSHYSCAVLAV